MIKFENTLTPSPEQWEMIINGVRNPMNSWDKSDSYPAVDCGKCGKIEREGICKKEDRDCTVFECYEIGPNDRNLMMRLRNAGTDHRKFMRMITVYADITAPLYWWKEFDTYKVGTVANSCSTMHKIHAKEFTLEDFSCEHLNRIGTSTLWDVIDILNIARKIYLEGGEYKGEHYEPKDKRVWWQMIQLLPISYNQKRTVMMNYEVLANIYKSRKNHKLDEWSGKDCFKDLHRDCNTCVKRNTSECHGGKEDGFIQWIETLPYSELICGPSLKDVPICNEIMEEAKKRVKESA